MRLVYGYKATNENDPFVRAVNDAMEEFSEMTVSGAFAVDLFPMRAYFFAFSLYSLNLPSSLRPGLVPGCQLES